MKHPKVFVVHVKKGYDDRAKHMELMLSKQGIEFEYMLDGDICDLTDDVLNKYFSGKMRSKSPETSCATKHILIYKKMVDENIPYALVLEDDIFFRKNFANVFAKSVSEFEAIPSETPAFVGYESTCLKLIPRSQRKKGLVNHRAEFTQCTGAYLINHAFAKNMLDYINTNKCDRSIDWYMSHIGSQGIFEIYWSYPVIADQGSHNGMMLSAIAPARGRNSLTTRIKRRFTSAYKELIYFFR